MKRVVTTLFIVLMMCMSAWTEKVENVKYIDENGVEQTCSAATVVTSSEDPVEWTDDWYIVTDDNVTLSKGAVCSGVVHLILADGAKLMTTGITDHDNSIYTPGIQINGGLKFLTIYGQTNQTGQLIANGGTNAAGIGGGYFDDGSNIIINGGKVSASGGSYAAGIGGGKEGYGSNITINGGEVMAQGGWNAAGIGAGVDASTNNIYVATSLVVKAGAFPNTDEVIVKNRTATTDIARELSHHRYVMIEERTLEFTKTDAVAAIQAAAIDAKAEIESASTYKAAKNIQYRYKVDIDTVVNGFSREIERATTIEEADELRNLGIKWIEAYKEKALTEIANINEIEKVKADAIAEITSAGQGIKNTEMNKWIDAAINDIQKRSPDASIGIDEIKTQILTLIKFFQDGKEEGKADAFGTLGTEQNGPAVIVTDQDGKEIILYSPKSVKYIKVNDK